MGSDDAPRVHLAPFVDDPGDGPHAAFRAEVAQRTRLDPMPTLEQLSALTGVPVGALARHALVQWSSAGAEALLALGPREVADLIAQIDEVAADAPQAERAAAYDRLAGRVRWLAAGLGEPPPGPLT